MAFVLIIRIQYEFHHGFTIHPWVLSCVQLSESKEKDLRLPRSLREREKVRQAQCTVEDGTELQNIIRQVSYRSAVPQGEGEGAAGPVHSGGRHGASEHHQTGQL